MTITQFAERHDLPTGKALETAWRGQGFGSIEAFTVAVLNKIPSLEPRFDGASKTIRYLHYEKGDAQDVCTDSKLIEAIKTTLGL